MPTVCLEGVCAAVGGDGHRQAGCLQAEGQSACPGEGVEGGQRQGHGIILPDQARRFDHFPRCATSRQDSGLAAGAVSDRAGLDEAGQNRGRVRACIAFYGIWSLMIKSLALPGCTWVLAILRIHWSSCVR